jgi:hypothetical protein
MTFQKVKGALKSFIRNTHICVALMFDNFFRTQRENDLSQQYAMV